MIVLFVCILLSGAKYVLQFSRRDVLQNTDFDPAAIENHRLVWTFCFEAAGSKAEGSISYHVILKD